MPQISSKRIYFNVALFFLVALVGCLADLLTKYYAFKNLGMPGEYFAVEPVKGSYWLINGVFGFQTVLNEGGLFGMGQGHVDWLSGFSFVALIGIGVWMFCSAKKSLLLSLTFGLFVAGIFGNLYDRLGMPRLIWNYSNECHQIGEPVYAVRDWILVMIGSYHWPNFNIADSMIVCGVGLMLYHLFFVNDPGCSKDICAGSTTTEDFPKKNADAKSE